MVQQGGPSEWTYEHILAVTKSPEFRATSSLCCCERALSVPSTPGAVGLWCPRQPACGRCAIRNASNPVAASGLSRRLIGTTPLCHGNARPASEELNERMKAIRLNILCKSTCILQARGVHFSVYASPMQRSECSCQPM